MTTHLHRRIYLLDAKASDLGPTADASIQVAFKKDGISISRIALSINTRDLSPCGRDGFASCSDAQLDLMADALKELATEARKKHAIIKEAL